MKKRIHIAGLLALACLAALVLCLGATAADTPLSGFYTQADPDAAQTRINAAEFDGELTLLLPAGMSMDAVPLYYTCSDPGAAVAAVGANGASPVSSGDALNLTALCGTSDRCEITLRVRSGALSSEQKLVFRRIASVDALFLTSEDPVNQGREWVDSSEDKSNKAKGSMVMLASDGETVYSGALTQIKGRGNSTWNAPKKPYQIKLKDKADLLRTGDKANRAKTWVLLANYFDASLIHNSIALNFGRALGMDTTPESTPVSLYYDGEYRGAYLLTEKVEIKSGRVDITDLEEQNELANPDVEDLTTLPLAFGKTANGASYRYCENMNTPADITGGYLLEMDHVNRAQAEICYFVTTRGTHVVVKSPECCSQAEMDYIATRYQEFEDAVYNGGVNPTTGKAYTDYVELQSMAQCYLVNELTKNPDAFSTSAYFYQDAGSGLMTMGPVWDYDLALGVGLGGNSTECATPEHLFTAYSSLGGALYRIGSFRMEVQRMYAETAAPLIDVLCGDETAVSADGRLHSIAYYEQQLRDSAVYNAILWPDQQRYSGYQPGGKTWQGNVDFLKTYLRARGDWLGQTFAAWTADSYEPLGRYIDVPLNAWYYNYVEDATTNGLMQGPGGGMFNPQGLTTRAQAAQVIYNMEKPVTHPFVQVFSDVRQSDWFCTAVQWASDDGVVLGYPDGSFRPNQGVTRQDILVLLYRYAGSPAPTQNTLSSYADSAQVSAYAVQAVQWALETHIIEGYKDNTLRPRNTTTRAEFATIILRYFQEHH